MALTTTDISRYIPTFDENTGKYIDECPYTRHQRHRAIYKCRCNVSTIITTRQQFISHVKSKTHHELLKNYKKYYKDVDDAKTENKQYRIENDFLKRRMEQHERSRNQVNKTLKEKALDFTKTITELRKINEELVAKNTELSKKEDIMNQKIKRIKTQSIKINEEFDIMRTELSYKVQQINHLESELGIEDDDYKDIMNYK
jgi:chromosome segregation ATPase